MFARIPTVDAHAVQHVDPVPIVGVTAVRQDHLSASDRQVQPLDADTSVTTTSAAASDDTEAAAL